jgi:hypothetical protein
MNMTPCRALTFKHDKISRRIFGKDSVYFQSRAIGKKTPDFGCALNDMAACKKMNRADEKARASSIFLFRAVITMNRNNSPLRTLGKSFRIDL